MTETIATGTARTTDDAVLEHQRESQSRHLERIGVTGLLAAGFVVVALGALLLPGQRPLSLAALATSLAAYAIASRVEVEFPGFVALPTEAVFVGDVVRAAGADAAPRRLPGRCCSGGCPTSSGARSPADRLVLTVANCWFSVGPAVVSLRGRNARRAME